MLQARSEFCRGYREGVSLPKSLEKRFIRFFNIPSFSYIYSITKKYLL